MQAQKLNLLRMFGNVRDDALGLFYLNPIERRVDRNVEALFQRVREHRGGFRIGPRLRHSGKINANILRNFRQDQLEVLERKILLILAISAAQLILRTIGAFEGAPDHRRDFETRHWAPRGFPTRQYSILDATMN